MTKRMVIMLVSVGVIFGAIFGFQAFKAKMIKQFMASMKMPPVTVTTMEARLEPWQPRISAVGSLRAVRGVDLTSEIAGIVQTIRFKSGDEAAEDQVLVELNADADIALLHSMEAEAELARTTYERDQSQMSVQAVSQATLEADAAGLKSKQAQVAGQQALVDKKIIRAPFAGRLGISSVNLGQYLNAGDPVVTLQSLNPIYVDFYVPQQQISRIALAQKITATSDTYPGQTFDGKVTAINPKVDPDTRNIQVEALIENRKKELLPGMYASVVVDSGAVQQYLTLPQTAVAYNPYGESVYVIEDGGKGADGKPILTARQTFVTLGETRGDQVAILKGIQPGDRVATSGQLKLKNGSPVVINNTIQPSNEPAPKPVDQ